MLTAYTSDLKHSLMGSGKCDRNDTMYVKPGNIVKGRLVAWAPEEVSENLLASISTRTYNLLENHSIKLESMVLRYILKA